VSALFSSRDLKSRRRSPGPDRRDRRRIPTGDLRLVESSTDRRARARVESWTEFVDAIRRSTAARLELLKGREGGDLIPCPWDRLGTCDGTCRCGGSGTVTVDFLLDHYARLATEIMAIGARRSS